MQSVLQIPSRYKVQCWIEGEALLLNICFPQCNAGTCWAARGQAVQCRPGGPWILSDDGNCKQAAKIVPD